MNKQTKEDLLAFQSEPLKSKIARTMAKISEWYTYWENQVYVSFSGGKDSTVLADLCAQWCKLTGQTLYLAFVNTGLEYPEIQRFVKEYAQYLRDKYCIEVVLDILRPKMRFDEVIRKYGYPIIGKRQANIIYQARKARMKGQYTLRLRHLGVTPEEAKKMGLNLPSQEMLDRYEIAARDSIFGVEKYRPLIETDFLVGDTCCEIMKKIPAYLYQKETGRKPIIATMTEESAIRETAWLKNGCNSFTGNAKSAPMSFWRGQDILTYVKNESLPICSVYGDIIYEIDPDQIHIDDEYESQFGNVKLATSGCERTGCIFCGFGCHLEKEPSRFQRLKQTHPKQYEYCLEGGEYNVEGLWQPSKDGLGMKHVFDELNKIYGDGFIKY